MSLRLTHEVLHLGLRDPFRIARGRPRRPARRDTTVVVELRDDRYPGIVGVGEGYPDRFYGETPATMAAVFPLLLEAVGEIDPSDVRACTRPTWPWRPRSAVTGRLAAPSTSRCTTSSAR